MQSFVRERHPREELGDGVEAADLRANFVDFSDFNVEKPGREGGERERERKGMR